MGIIWDQIYGELGSNEGNALGNEPNAVAPKFTAISNWRKTATREIKWHKWQYLQMAILGNTAILGNSWQYLQMICTSGNTCKWQYLAILQYCNTWQCLQLIRVATLANGNTWQYCNTWRFLAILPIDTSGNTSNWYKWQYLEMAILGNTAILGDSWQCLQTIQVVILAIAAANLKVLTQPCLGLIFLWQLSEFCHRQPFSTLWAR